jgi:hypothetical protein
VALGQSLPKFTLSTEDGERLLICTFPQVEFTHKTPAGQDVIRLEVQGLKKGLGAKARHGIQVEVFVPDWQNYRDGRGPTLARLRLGEKDCGTYAEALLAARGYAKRLLTETVERREFHAARWNYVVITTTKAGKEEKLSDNGFPRLLLMFGENPGNADWTGIAPSFQDEVVTSLTKTLLGFDNIKTLLDSYNADISGG